MSLVQPKSETHKIITLALNSIVQYDELNVNLLLNGQKTSILPHFIQLLLLPENDTAILI